MTDQTQPAKPRGRGARFARYGAYFIAADIALTGLAALVIAR